MSTTTLIFEMIFTPGGLVIVAAICLALIGIALWRN